MMSLSADKDAEIIEAFNSKSRYLDDLLNIDNTYFDGMVKQIYPAEIQLNKANIRIEFIDLPSIFDGMVKQIYPAELQLNKANIRIEFIDLPSIFKSRSVTSSISIHFQNSEPSIICYKYTSP